MALFSSTDKRVPANVSEADLELAESLDSLDDAENYARWIFDLVEPNLGRRVLEVGAGHGTFTELLAQDGRTVVAQDISERCIGVLEERFAEQPRVLVSPAGFVDLKAEGPFDSAVLINVLEHIPDDDEALAQLSDLLGPGGNLILWVPAFQLLYTEFDRRVGHHRRYRRPELAAKLQAAGFGVVTSRYVNSLGGLAWLLYARMLRRTPTTGGSVRIFDRYVVPPLRRVEAKWRTPFGQSICVVARKER